ncbi:TELO2-interacting protein 1 [Entomortierella parvispora]|uniref:TELO2-interacting protein 1 n=1 Tax=Entomortierella parvispora TaxID=205924 RepID=A0A9P3LVI4_9FUNG|nr:TELO2-interacting protein 1 [Entomortierella parvispora]
MSANKTLPETEAAFEMLRGPSSRILSLPSVGSSNATLLARDLDAIASVLGHMPDPEAIMTTQLIAYVHHTLNHVLRLCHLFKTTEKRFDFVVEPWCSCFESLMRLPDGYQLVVDSGWRYLRLLFDVLFVTVDGIPVAVKDPAKSQGKQPAAREKDVMSDDTRLAALRCLILLLPLSSSTPGIDTSASDIDFPDGSIILGGDRVQRTNADSSILEQLLEPVNQSLLGQLIVVLLDTAKEAGLVALRTTALEGVMKLLKCLETPRRVANWIPGISAGLTKIMLERGPKENHLVQTHCLHIWTFMVVLVLRGWQMERGRALGSTTTSSDSSLGASLMDMYKAKATASTATPSPELDFASDEWLNKLLHGLQTLFAKIGPIRLHPHWKVRLQFADMAFSILKDCQGSILSKDLVGSTSIACFLLETLIGSTQDDYEQVSKPASKNLRVLALQYTSQDLTSASKEILRSRLVALPRILYGPDESLKQSDIRMLQGLALFLGREMEGIMTYQSLWGFAQPWINILRIEQLDHHNMDEQRGILGLNSTTTGEDSTSEEIRWAAWTMKRHGSDRKFGFPRRIHLHLREQTTADAFLAFVRQIGASTDLNLWMDDLTLRLQRDTQGVRENDGWFGADTVSTILLMNHLLLGAANVGLTSYEAVEQPLSTNTESVDRKLKKQAALERKRQRQVRRSARGILEDYLEVLAACSQLSPDAMAREDADRRARTRVAEEDESVSRKQALKALMLTLDEDSVDFVLPESRIYDPNTDVLLRCLLLQGIASVAVVMGGEEFELELIKVLYVLLEHLGDQNSALVRDTAHAALEHVAFVCHAESIGDLIQSNYDYVIQQVSQRIAFLSANPTTPQVLWSLVHVVGMPAVSMLEDSVTEIFEALDSWRSKEDQVGEGLFKSLVEIVKVIAESTLAHDAKPVPKSHGLTSAQLPSAEVAEYARAYRIMVSGTDDQKAPSQEDFDEEMKKKTPEEIEEYFNKVLQDTKEREENRLGQKEDSAESEGEDEDMMSFGELRSKMPKPSKEPKEEPMSKHEALSLRILNKAGYFLTASSPRLQILALEVIQSAIVVLGRRSTELNTAVYAFWPQIVSRALQRSELDMFYVSLRAIEVITLLAKASSDFLARHLLDDVWPFLLRAMESWITAPAPFGKEGKARSTGYVARLGGPETSADKESRIISSHGGLKQQSHSRQRLGKIFTKEHRLQMTILKSVSQIVQQVRIPVKEVWTMLLLARDIMLDQQLIFHKEVRLAAADVIQSVAKAGHGDSVWLVLTAALEEVEEIDEEDDSIPMCQDILRFMEEGGL